MVPGWSKTPGFRPVRALLLAAGLAGLAGRAAEFQPAVPVPAQRPLVLALGGGGAKGIAHVGVLQRLEEEGIPVAGIAGTSAGAFTGGLYAAGYSGAAIQALLETYDLGALMLDRNRRAPGETLREQEDAEVAWLHFLVAPGQGLTSSPGAHTGRNLRRVLQILLARCNAEANVSFDLLRVPFRAVATDLRTGRAFAPAQGDLPSAVCASMSIPGMLSPVLWDGHPLVDGVLVQNLPVETARRVSPGAAVLAVEVGQGLAGSVHSSVLGLAFRALDVSIDSRTELSRQAADLVLRPSTAAIQYLEFHRQVQDAVAEGRRAFDANLDALEDLIYGPVAAQPAPGGPPSVTGPDSLTGRAAELARLTLPDGPRVNRHYFRWVRRVQAEGLARRADLRFTPAGPVLALDPYPALTRVAVTVPEAWRTLLADLLRDHGVTAGARYNPVRLARCLDTLALRASLLGHPWLKIERTAFDPERGVLEIEVQDVWPRRFLVAGDQVSKAQADGLQRLLRTLEGRPLDARAVAEALMLAEKRMALEDLRLAPVPADPGGATLQVKPIPDRRMVLEGQLAYESTWEGHAELGLRSGHAFGSDLALGARIRTDRLQDSAVLEGSRISDSWPRLSWRATAAQTVYRFLPESLRAPYLPAPFQASLAGRSLQTRSLGLEGSARFGREDRGMASLGLERAWHALHPAAVDLPLPAATQVQAQAEWDDLDRCLFPSRGSSTRIKAGLGRLDQADPWSGRNRYGFACAQVTRLWPLAPWASLQGEAEAGLGWRLPVSHWYSVGGPAFLAGTPSGALRVPNFALARVGLPMTLVQVFGANLQVVPRVDLGRLAVAEPGQLGASPQVRGLSLAVRGEVWRWYWELAGGRWTSHSPGPQEGFRLNLLVGARPFSFWRNP